MQKIVLFFFTAFILYSHISSAQDAPPSSPDFSPPKDMTGPVFPPEELIGKPGPETDRFLTEFISMLATLGLIISLILILAWFLKRMVNNSQMQGNETSLIKIIDRRSLSPKALVYLLEIEGKTLVVAESQTGVTALAQYDSPEDDAEAKTPTAFKKLLDQ